MSKLKWDAEDAEAAAKEAEQELESIVNGEADNVAVLATWWKNYYMRCGHKRLGRILLQYQL